MFAGVVKVNLWSSGDIVLPLFCLLEKKFCTVSLQQSSNCLGGFSKSHHLDDSTVNLPKQNKESGRGSQRNASPFDRSWWTSSSNEMENNGNIPHQQRSTLSLSTNHNAQETQATTSDNVNNAAFVNHALILWTERRREWVGSQQRSQPEEHREPVIGYNKPLVPKAGIDEFVATQSLVDGWALSVPVSETCKIAVNLS
jgi:hypothetical protein